MYSSLQNLLSRFSRHQSLYERKLQPYFRQEGRVLIADVDFSEIEPLEKYFLCFTNRSGSNYLAELLASTGTFNLAGEIFNCDTVIKRTNQSNYLSFDEYVCETIKARTSMRFIAKVGISQLEFLQNIGLLDSIFSNAKYILIERSDKVSQAISREIAFQTKEWRSFKNQNKNPTGVNFVASDIDYRIKKIIDNYTSFDKFFVSRDVVPAHVNYESLEIEPELTTTLTLQKLGLKKSAIDPRKVRLKKQRNELNEEFHRKYLAHKEMKSAR